MGDYQRSITINATRRQIEDYVSNVNNLSKYLPTVHSAQKEQGERVRVEGAAPNGYQYDSDGYFRIDKNSNRMEWGSDGETQYAGWMEFKASNSQTPTEVTVHLSLTPPPHVQQEMAKHEGSASNAIEDGIEKALQSIKNELEGHGGKQDY